MAKLAHLLVLSVLIVWLAGSGCVGNDTSDAEEAGIATNGAGAENGVPDDSEIEITQAEIQELDSDITALECLLEVANFEEELIDEDLAIEYLKGK